MPPAARDDGEAGMPMAPIPSATLVVLAPCAAHQWRAPQWRTLLVSRSARLGSSFRSAVVFPGGAVDAADYAALHVPHGERKSAAGKRALQLAALRETFEETGLLLVPSRSTGSRLSSRAVGAGEAGVSVEEWARMREAVHNDASRFAPFLAQVCKHLGIAGDADSADALPLAAMMEFSRWITPRTIVRPAKRFDAHFFLTVLDAPDVLTPDTASASGASEGIAATTKGGLGLSADGTETLNLKVETPADILAAAMREEFLLMPPQFYILADIAAALERPGAGGVEALRPLRFLDAPGVGKKAHGVSPVYTEDRPAELTAIEPRFMPKAGKTMPLPHASNASAADPAEQERYVFPLVMPGDVDCSAEQRLAAGLPARPPQAQHGAPRILNRVLVSPRPGGGGVSVFGVIRRGMPGLEDMSLGWTGEDDGESIAPKL